MVSEAAAPIGTAREHRKYEEEGHHYLLMIFAPTAKSAESVAMRKTDQVMCAASFHCASEGQEATPESRGSHAHVAFPETSLILTLEFIASTCEGVRSEWRLDGPSIVLHLFSSLGRTAHLRVNYRRLSNGFSRTNPIFIAPFGNYRN